MDKSIERIIRRTLEDARAVGRDHLTQTDLDALLVSHWPVSSEAAVALTTQMLTEYANDPGIGRAQALRRSMMALMMNDENPRFAHPFYWAPFVIVGEGGVPERATR